MWPVNLKENSAAKAKLDITCLFIGLYLKFRWPQGGGENYSFFQQTTNTDRLWPIFQSLLIGKKGIFSACEKKAMAMKLCTNETSKNDVVIAGPGSNMSVSYGG